MEEGQTTDPAQPAQPPAQPNGPGDDHAGGLSHETIILPKGSGVLESARAQAEASGIAPIKASEPEESVAGNHLKMVLLAVTVTWLSWFLSLVIQFRLAFALRKVVYTSFLACGVASVILYGIKRIAASPGLLLRSIFAGCALSFLLSCGVLILDNYSTPKTVEVAWLVTFLTLFGAMILLALLRIGYRLFGQMQTRLNEWVVTLFAAGLLMAAAMAWLDSLRPGSAEPARIVVYMLASVALTVAGSTWSWTIARQLGEEHPRRRLRLMVIGWLLVAGLLALSIFAWCLLLVLLDGWNSLRSDSMFHSMFYYSMLGTALTVPGVLLQWRAKRAAAAKAPTEGCP